MNFTKVDFNPDYGGQLAKSKDLTEQSNSKNFIPIQSSDDTAHNKQSS
ncbi:MAG: hypothetical protein ACK5IC_03780 [Moheibacter sp.]